MKNGFQALALERTLNRFASDLLPPGTRLHVAHDEVLVIDSCELEVQLPSAYCCFPHQTGVTERSIGGDDRSASDNVLDQMMVGHQAHRIRGRFAIDLNRQNDVIFSHERRVIYFGVGRIR